MLLDSLGLPPPIQESLRLQMRPMGDHQPLPQMVGGLQVLQRVDRQLRQKEGGRQFLPMEEDLQPRDHQFLPMQVHLEVDQKHQERVLLATNLVVYKDRTPLVFDMEEEILVVDRFGAGPQQAEEQLQQVLRHRDFLDWRLLEG
jgi:hypothetical protein